MEISRLILCTLLIAGGPAGCIGSDTPAREDVFIRSIGDDLNAARSIWASRDLSAQSVEIVYEEAVADYRVLIVRHRLEANDHYGVIVAPEGDHAGRPVMLIADGLNQTNPNLNPEGMIASHSGQSPAAGMIKIIPTFRGRTLRYGDMQFHADGDFCDAYDGAADDAIAMLNVAESLFPEANFERVLAEGASRGGNTALLMGVRDARIDTIIAMAAPVDFYWDPLVDKYGEQYACQFLDGKTAEQARRKILQSSPLYFEAMANVEDVFLFHGSRDEVVSLWNSLDIAGHLEARGVSVTSFFYPNSTHRSFPSRPEHPENHAAAVEKFLGKLEVPGR